MKTISLSVAGALATIGLMAAAGAASNPKAGAPAAKPTTLSVTSSLDGLKTLPQRVRWLAYPKVAAGEDRPIFEVDFLVDGKVRCVEHFAPWNYGSDDFHGHLGWLVTSWLEPGLHRFTVRAAFQDGTSAEDTVVARVTPAPVLPAALTTGRWERTLTKAERAKYKGDLPTGTWQLVFDRVGVWELDPLGTGIAEHVVVQGKTIRVDAALWTVPYDMDGHYANFRRYGHKDIGAGWREDGPPASYRWSVSGDRLTLTAVDEISRSRHALWEGTWTRVVR